MKKSHHTRLLSLILALVVSVSLCVPAFAAGTDSFSDVKTTAWYYSDVTECAALGIVAGYGDGSFLPDDNVTSIQFLTMLTRTFYASELDQITVPAGQPWYYANTTVASDIGISKDIAAADINDTKGMTRYNMALVLSNILTANGKTITAGNRAQAAASITDYSKIPANSGYHNPVTTCYGLGIITGMSDGSFSGEQSMTRAQACAVIMRMMDLVQGKLPAESSAPTTPAAPEQTQQPESPAGTGKLANGKDATVDNVLEILAQLEQEYPDGTIWGPTTTYSAGTKSAVKSITGGISTAFACGGFAALVSDRIFGQTAPCREVTDPSKVRAGDVAVAYNAKGVSLHVGIASESAHTISTLSGAIAYGFTTCDGNANGGYVSWNRDGWAYLGTQSNGSYVRVFTRYPEELSQ